MVRLLKVFIATCVFVLGQDIARACDSANVELVVKVLEGCSENGSRWAYVSGLTNVGVVLTVTDIVSGLPVYYSKPVGVAFQPIQDTTASPCT